MTKLVQEQGWKSDGQMANGQVRQNEDMLSQSSQTETNHDPRHTDVKRGSIKLFGSIEFIATILAMAEMTGAKGLSSCHTDQKFNSPDLPHTRDTYNFNLPDGQRYVRVIVEAWDKTPPTEF